jgi:uncharacterized protein
MDLVTEFIRDPLQLEGILGTPTERVRGKVRDAFDESSRAFIAHSPLLFIASVDADGNLDVSPRGDPPGSVRVLDERSLAIAERPGNRRGDTLRNVLQRPSVALIFLIPGRGETLRVNGAGAIVRDAWLREGMAVEGRVPDLALVVSVREVFAHCPKCALRSRLWDPGSWPTAESLAACAQIPLRGSLY